MEPNEFLQLLMERSMELLSKGRTINTINPTNEEIKEYFKFYMDFENIKMKISFLSNLAMSTN
jgi:hypothetical protein